MARRFGRLREGVLEDLELLGLDGGARAAPLGAGAAFVGRLGLGRVVAAALALAVAVHRSCVCPMSNLPIDQLTK